MVLEIAVLPIYRKCQARQTLLILMLMMPTYEYLTLCLRLPILPLPDYICHLLVLLLLKEGINKSYRVLNVYFHCFCCSCISDVGTIQVNVNATVFAEKQNRKGHSDIISLGLNQETDKRMSPDGTRKLQDEINTLTKRNCELESQLRNLEAGHSKDFHDTLDGADIGKKMK